MSSHVDTVAHPQRIRLFRAGLTLIALILALLLSAATAKGEVYYDDLGETELGDGVHSQWDHNFLTYGFVNGTSDIAGEAEKKAVREGMSLWTAETPITLHEVDPEVAEIKISWGSIDGAGNVVARSNFPSWPLSGDILFDDGETWTTASRSNNSQPIDLVTTAAHEIGHSLGLEHSASSFDLMYRKYVGSHRFLWSGDINAITWAYGSHPGRGYFLRNSSTIGLPNIGLNLGQSGDRPIAGDWDGDGDDTPGYYRPSNSRFYLRNSNSTGPADVSFVFGASQDLPVAGDWNEDGIDTIGVYRPSNGSFYLSNSNNGACCNYQFAYGNNEDLPVAGDWNKSGTDTIGVYRPSTGVFYLRDTNSFGPVDYAFAYGNSNEDRPIAGDWDGDGYHSVGVFRTGNDVWYLDNSLPGTNPVDYVFPFGTVGPRIPIAGDWNGDGTDSPGTVQD
jgi:hypothetical protein